MVRFNELKPRKGCWVSQKVTIPTVNVEKTTPKEASNRIVNLSFNSSWTLIEIAPANKRKGSITSISKVLKSNFWVMLEAASKKSGKTNPTIKTITDKIIAKTINPIVWGSFKSLKFTIEKIEAKRSKIVESSRMFIFFVLPLI